MTHVATIRPSTRFAGALLTLALAPTAAFSACSGGGYSTPGASTPTAQTPTPTWTTDPSASASAVVSSNGILYALESASKPIGIWDDRLQSLSKTTAFIDVAPSAADAFITREGLEVRTPALAVGDAYGNIIWASTASTSVTEVIAALHAAPEAFQDTLKRTTQQVALAKSDRAHGHLALALKRLSGVMQLKGYPAVSEAKALYAEIIASGEAEVTKCLADAAADPASAKSKLRLMSVQYVHTPVDDQVSCAMKSLQ